MFLFLASAVALHLEGYGTCKFKEPGLKGAGASDNCLMLIVEQVVRTPPRPSSVVQRQRMGSRLYQFWMRISDGIAIQQLWSQLHGEARASYRLYSKDLDLTRGAGEKRARLTGRVASELFWAMVSKLSPARRVLFVLSLILLVVPGFDFRFKGGESNIPNLAFLGALILVVLLALELADRVALKRDLEIAKEIQTWLMPEAPPSVPGIDMAFATRPANTVAGDYYDAFLRSSSEGVTRENAPLLVAMADVAGKSVPAALLMATLQASLRTLSSLCTDVTELVVRWNRYCCEQNVGGQRFTTAFLAEFNPLTREMNYVNAGHNYPVLRRASGEIERLEIGCIPLGLLRNAPYQSGKVTLAVGDILLIFTDGLVEAEDAKEQEYGERRMLTTLHLASTSAAPAILRSMMLSADQFVGSTPQHDDITCLVLRTIPR